MGKCGSGLETRLAPITPSFLPEMFAEVTLRAASHSSARKLLEIHEKIVHPLAESDSAVLTTDLLLPASLRGVRACLR